VARARVTELLRIIFLAKGVKSFPSVLYFSKNSDTITQIEEKTMSDVK